MPWLRFMLSRKGGLAKSYGFTINHAENRKGRRQDWDAQ